ncbi:response regulator [Brevundimonas sp. G8]|uniref:response regulator n=1 Tax=Brevundimonas sp. G8 TaxID=1350776 RepID=UPI0012EFC873|nr:response regulator [Brevundimonas sp. G8]VXB83404.1 Sensory box sensor histidine kinase/response regulator [Brevundimonas sp. G8]
MSRGGELSERALVLAPVGRDAVVAAQILNEAGTVAQVCDTLDDLLARMIEGAALAVVVEEMLINGDLNALSTWIEGQPSWSDFPFLVLNRRGGSVERNPAARRLSVTLGNVSFLERPFHPTTLVSAVDTALRGRRRQYEARERIAEIQRAEAMLERRVADRTAQLQDANRELAAQIVEREKVETALRQAQRLEAVGQLTSGVAHDFNNLLTVVLGNVDQLRKNESDPKVLRRLDMMREASQRGARLTAQMLAFSRRQKLEPRAVDLNETVRSMGDMLQSAIGGSVQIQPPQLAPDLWPAMIDPTQIELVILNLAINARDAMEVGGSLTIRTENAATAAQTGVLGQPEELPAGDYVVVSVSDTGSGMSEDVLSRAFEPFFTTKEVGKGSGLGLSQVFGLAKQSGGGVSIDTEVGTGTTIRIFLPRAEAQPMQEREASGELMTAHDAGLVVLVVDDDEAVRNVTAGYLSDLGYDVIEADSGGAALESLDHHDRIDAMVLDFAMPGMNGGELARELKARRPSAPILFATGYADAEALIDVGEDLIVRKPFTQAELARKLSRTLAA